VTSRDGQLKQVSGHSRTGSRISWGDGRVTSEARTRARHVYARPGRYRVVARLRDKAGNVSTRRFRIVVR